MKNSYDIAIDVENKPKAEKVTEAALLKWKTTIKSAIPIMHLNIYLTFD